MPRVARTRSEPASHLLGMMKGSPPWSALNASAFCCCRLIICTGFYLLACTRRRARAGLDDVRRSLAPEGRIRCQMRTGRRCLRRDYLVRSELTVVLEET